MPLEYVSVYLTSIPEHVSNHWTFRADLRELCTASDSRILQRRGIPSNHRRTSSPQSNTYPRIRAHRLYVKDFMVQGGDPTGTGKGGTSIYGQKLYVYPTVGYKSPRLPSSQRRRDSPRATIHRRRNPRDGQLGA
jgi:cyclophilin family peptidyl-prolyl cis-trans isomerase